MRLQESIRRILREEMPLNLKRRLSSDKLDDVFKRSLDIESIRYVKFIDKWNLMTLHKFKNMVVSRIMDDYIYPSLGTDPKNDLIYDDVEKYLLTHYSAPMERMYKAINRETMNESEEDNKHKFSALENAVTKFIDFNIKQYKLPENFSHTAVDVYMGDYGLVCKVTFLMKKPFAKDDSEYLLDGIWYGKRLRNVIKSFFGDEFTDISAGTSTISHYNETNWYYKEKKK